METCEIQVSADALGFSAPPAPPAAPQLASDLANRPEVLALAPDERASLFETLIQQNSLVAVEQIARDLAFQATSPNTTIPQKLSIAEFHAKLAKLDKKAAAEVVGGGVSITINIPAIDSAPSRAITIDQQPTEVVEIDIDPET
jgi:hypothetical protein